MRLLHSTPAVSHGVSHGTVRTLALVAVLVAAVTLAVAAGPAQAASSQAPPTLSFFSGGGGAYVDWEATTDQPPGDTDNQAIRLVTTTSGYAEILFHHVEGIPAASFPDSEFWVKSRNYSGPSLGSPRLVVVFETAAGTPDGDAELNPNTLTGMWQDVSDVNDYPDSGWDIHSSACPFAYHQQWSTAQSCHAGDVVSDVHLGTDPYARDHLIDDLVVDGKRFSSAADNSGGDNSPAG